MIVHKEKKRAQLLLEKLKFESALPPGAAAESSESDLAIANMQTVRNTIYIAIQQTRNLRKIRVKSRLIRSIQRATGIFSD